MRRNVVVTGSTQGTGLALARKLLSLGDSVVVCSRTASRVSAVVAELGAAFPNAKVVGTTVDVSDAASVDALMAFAKAQLGSVDIVLNNAGVSQSPLQPLADTPVATIESIVSTNVLGTLLCTRAAIRAAADQPDGVHIFNMEGAGSRRLMATPRFATYGFSKAGMVQLRNSLVKELKGSNVGVHNMSPGMVITDLLVNEGTKSAGAFWFFNVLAERPDTVRLPAVLGGRDVAGGEENTNVSKGGTRERWPTSSFRASARPRARATRARRSST